MHRTHDAGMIGRRVARPLAPVFLAMVLLGQLVAPAAGDHGGRPVGSFLRCDRPVVPPRCTSVGDNLVHRVHFDATLTDALAASMRDAMAVYDNATKFVMIEDPALSAATDVIAYSEDYGDNGAAGWVNCPSTAPQGLNPSGHRWCRMQELYLNLSPRYGIFFADDASRDHVACHELGHTVGLRHWGNPPESAGPAAATCMTANTPNGSTTIHQIDIDHINAYPYGLPPTPPMRRFTLLASPWTGAGVEATEIESADSLEALVSSADAVILGRVTAVEPGRVFGGATGRPFHYAAATVTVEEVVAGFLPAVDASALTLEIPLFEGPDSIAALRSAVPGPQSLFFLRSKAESARAVGLSAAEQVAEAPYYRLVVLRGLIENYLGQAAVADDEVGPLSPLDGRAFGEVLRDVRHIGS
jgi:hypothetical protein